MLEKMSIDLAIRRYIDITLHEVGVDEAKLTDTLAEVPFRRFFYYWRQKHTEPIVSQQEVEDMVHAFLSDSWEQYYRHPQQEFEKKWSELRRDPAFEGVKRGVFEQVNREWLAAYAQRYAAFVRKYANKPRDRKSWLFPRMAAQWLYAYLPSELSALIALRIRLTILRAHLSYTS